MTNSYLKLLLGCINNKLQHSLPANNNDKCGLKKAYWYLFECNRIFSSFLYQIIT